MTHENNGHSCIRFRVTISQCSPTDGRQLEYYSHMSTVAEAIQEALVEYLSEDRSNEMPMNGISVYQCVFTA
jgi:hypothetical protein